MRTLLQGFACCAAFTIAAAFIGSGCVAFNVGKPETFTQTNQIVETISPPFQTEVITSDAQLQERDFEVVVSLSLEIQEKFETREHSETFTVRKQKRLAIGLFPGASEAFLMPDGALAITDASPHVNPKRSNEYIYFGNPSDNNFVGAQIAGTLIGVPVVIGTVYSLLCAPFDNWSCSHHSYFDPRFVKKCSDNPFYWDTSGSPKLKALQRMPADVRRGINTCYEYPIYSGGGLHLGLIGCHKYLAVFMDGPMESQSKNGAPKARRTSTVANGPYIAELSVPVLNHIDRKLVSARDTQAVFALPAVERDCMVEAVVSFREDNSVNGRNASDLTRQALAKAAGRQWRFDVALKGTGRVDSGGHQKSEPVLQPPPLKDFEVVTIKPLGDGQYLVRVEVKDKSKTFSILHLIKPEVYRLVHENFRSKNPVEPAQFVRESMRYETEEDGRILSFTGWVFSVRPIDEGWHYDDESRTGWLRLRIMGGIPAVEAERWAHENIGEIVKYKNVVLEEGRAPPPGAKFRSLSEHCENGVLTVEFEALQ